jgi:hypothetical protein
MLSAIFAKPMNPVSIFEGDFAHKIALPRPSLGAILHGCAICQAGAATAENFALPLQFPQSRCSRCYLQRFCSEKFIPGAA